MKRMLATLVVAGILGCLVRESEAAIAKMPLKLDPLTITTHVAAATPSPDSVQLVRHGHRGHHGHHGHHGGHFRHGFHHHHGHHHRWHHPGIYGGYYAPRVYYPPVYSYPYAYPYGGSSFGLYIGF
jgi:hypothetical protein